MITSTLKRKQYTCNGTGPYPITFDCTTEGGNATNVAAVVTLTATGAWVADLTLSGGGLTTTLLNAYTTTSYDNTHTITLYRTMPFTQLRDMVKNGTLSLETLETIVDEIYLHLQDLDYKTDRAVVVPIHDETVDMEGQTKSDRASKVQAFNSDGEPIAVEITYNAGLVTAFAETLLDDTTAGAMLTTLGVSAFIQTLLNDADAATARTTLGAAATSHTHDDRYYTETEVGTLLTNLTNALYPIGTTYTQYPGKDSPTELGLPGTWENISDEFAGDFFRAEGGDAETFEGGEQAHQFEDHVHDFQHYSGDAAGNTSTRFRRTDETNTIHMNTKGANSGNYGTETRPVNVTIRIWERTS